MHEYCEKCVDKKHNMHTIMHHEEVESLDASNSDLEISNKGSIKIIRDQIYFKFLDE